MKKKILIVGLVVLAVSVFSVGAVFAQGVQPPVGGGQGALHTFMATEFAKSLKLNVNDVNTRLNAGETMYDIALSSGVTAEQFPALMTEVRANALAAAVKANVITQAQADFMKSRGFGQGGYGNGNCPMSDGDENGAGYGRGQGFGMMGGGRWNQQTNP